MLMVGKEAKVVEKKEEVKQQAKDMARTALGTIGGDNSNGIIKHLGEADSQVEKEDRGILNRHGEADCPVGKT